MSAPPHAVASLRRRAIDELEEFLISATCLHRIKIDRLMSAVGHKTGPAAMFAPCTLRAA